MWRRFMTMAQKGTWQIRDVKSGQPGSTPMSSIPSKSCSTGA